MNKKVPLVIIGGGPAGLAAAVSALENGLKPEDILILERDERLGGILNQCIHNGFGLHTFKEELTGPEYAQRYIDKVLEAKIPYQLSTMVIDLKDDKTVRCVHDGGLETIEADAVVLAMGCRERPRGALNIPGSRPAGIYTAGTAQKLVNLDGWMPGKDVVILGSGDIGLIMARRMSLEGAKVHKVAELMPYSAGLKRNIVQCLEDYNIPLELSHTVTQIKGNERVESVVISQVDEHKNPIPGTEEEIPCDTLLLSCGLIPENELSQKGNVQLSRITNGPLVDEHLCTSVDGIFACGNVLHVHDLVDFVSQEASQAGAAAADYILHGKKREHELNEKIPVKTSGGVRYTVPSHIEISDMPETLPLRFRVADVLKNTNVVIKAGEREVYRRKKRVMNPSEMETIQIKKEWFDPSDKTIQVYTEEAAV